MADFCNQCAKAHGFISEDLKGLCKADEVVFALCEGCGPTYVDAEGNCVGPCSGEWPRGTPHPKEGA